MTSTSGSVGVLNIRREIEEDEVGIASATPLLKSSNSSMANLQLVVAALLLLSLSSASASASATSSSTKERGNHWGSAKRANSGYYMQPICTMGMGRLLFLRTCCRSSLWEKDRGNQKPRMDTFKRFRKSEGTPEYVIEAVPLSFKLPNSDTIYRITNPKEITIEKQMPIEELKEVWIKKALKEGWIQKATRPGNGQEDKEAYHVHENCSMVTRAHHNNSHRTQCFRYFGSSSQPKTAGKCSEL
ncbi:hypothetical protein Vadar_016028 [Vaccinium darrowii]|uniref:Uncharacterized protein n=1 Tax=Vaccinium darrowii TaxID=229202 RepID=A0ACB7ZJB1_9ERIC|nr:hypothetical protein Vadar_016028 [Vaccinium darrowii]